MSSGSGSFAGSETAGADAFLFVLGSDFEAVDTGPIETTGL